MKKYVLLFINTILKLINQQRKLKLIIKRWFLIRKSILNYLVAFLIKYLLNIKIIFNFAFEKIIDFDFENVKSLFSKAKRDYIRGYAYIRYKLETRHKYLDLYKIHGTLNFDPNLIYDTPKTYPNFQKDLEKFKKDMIQFVERNEGKIYYRFGDGEYYFLTRQAIGSAAPGHRALTKSFNEINHQEFVEGVLKNDFICTLLYPRSRSRFIELYPERKIDYPSEYIYGLLANNWFIRTFKGKIGLIGAKEKLHLIEKLLEYKKYRDYLGIDKFNDYIYIPQKFAADDVKSLEKIVSEQLKNSNSAIFLLGIGHVKSAILYKLTLYKKAVYIDVGSGIDTLAGVIKVTKPFLGAWTNFRIRNYNYSNIDYMNYQGWGKHVHLNNHNSYKNKSRSFLSNIKSLLKVCFTRFKINLLLKYHFIYKRYLKYFKGLKFAPKHPTKVPWSNTTLKSRGDVELSLKIIKNSNLNLHPNREKNWDSLIALKTILQNSSPSSRILDAGGDLDSIILHWLYQFNYKYLYALNLVFKKRVRKGNIEKIPGDLTKSPFPNNYFDIITCLSVIEHGVDGDQYFREMNRILKPNGLLITSTDYWISKIDTRDLLAYNNPIYIFDKNSIEILLKKAKDYGFRIFGKNVELTCQEQVVNWKRFNLNFTFLIFCLKKIM